MEAAAFGEEEIAKMLIERIFKGFNETLAVNNFINAQDDLGQTALSEARKSGWPAIAKMLVAAGAK